MQWTPFAGALAAMLAASGTALAQTPSWTPPSENQRCPSKWGAGDERGSANHQTAEGGDHCYFGHAIQHGAIAAVAQGLWLLEDGVGAALRRAHQTHIYERVLQPAW